MVDEKGKKKVERLRAHCIYAHVVHVPLIICLCPDSFDTLAFVNRNISSYRSSVWNQRKISPIIAWEMCYWRYIAHVSINHIDYFLVLMLREGWVRFHEDPKGQPDVSDTSYFHCEQGQFGTDAENRR